MDTNDIQNLKNRAIADILNCENETELEAVRVKLLGTKGEITQVVRSIGKLPIEEKKAVGRAINETLQIIRNELANKKIFFTDPKTTDTWFDPTLPGVKPQTGHLHLISQAIHEISTIFEKIGFNRERYREVEYDYYAFGALNFPDNHPARDDWETFFIDAKPDPQKGAVLLTPHTSSGQIREMETKKPPIRMINIAKTYRRQSDISHSAMFHQFEGLVIDRGINIRHLKGTLDYFAKSYFGPEAKSRIRPYHFMFTEPSFEVDFSCSICNGVGCGLCKEGWVEVGGAGMVHPNVLKAGGIDSTKYSGFAFGWGVERVIMMRPGIGIPDLRILYSTDLDYLKQF